MTNPSEPQFHWVSQGREWWCQLEVHGQQAGRLNKAEHTLQSCAFPLRGPGWGGTLQEEASALDSRDAPSPVLVTSVLTVA